MPTAIVRPRPTAGLWSPISAMASLCRAARLRFDRCATAPETRPLPAVSRAHPSRDVDRLSSGVRREGVIPRPVVRGPMAVALPRSRSPCTLPPDGFERATAGYVDRQQTGWGPVIGRERCRVRLVIASPPSRPRRRSNSDHPGKSTYSGEIDYRFLTFQPGSRF